MKKRIIYASCFFVILIIEIIIGVYIHDAFIRPYIGDVLVVILICCFIRIFILRSLRRLPVYVFVFACFIELLQYFQLADRLELSNNGFARIVLGATFDWKDILCYAVGCSLFGLVEYAVRCVLIMSRFMAIRALHIFQLFIFFHHRYGYDACGHCYNGITH